ncbi:histidine phosphatase family protein [Rhodoferax aquaticus]|uniref:Phosphoglycerate kinase n=1 Tax=Rhodoferax aquaticus TaxID=2527691 RepID=A0A515EN95_9BURK|nr:histidine phosphatase family protein [Rhodoferax aquaticus]QDL54133.1 phosphoglycerate kinase [Rhodoferax aquaticus]
MKLWLVRHALPLVAQGTCYGATDLAVDPAANAHLAAELAERLPRLDTGMRLQMLHSPLQRCEQLAQHLQGLRPDLVSVSEPRLAEMNFGDWEGQAWSDIPEAAYAQWTADFAQHRFGGQECVAEFMHRVAQVWDAMLAAPRSDHVVWLTHAGVIRAATLLAQGVREVHTAQDWPKAAPGFGQWRCFNVGV